MHKVKHQRLQTSCKAMRGEGECHQTGAAPVHFTVNRRETQPWSDTALNSSIQAASIQSKIKLKVEVLLFGE